jgi:SAM-dependent methyltransferase
MLDSTQRFSDRVDNYINYRPSYPRSILKLFREFLSDDSVVADIGSGTGKLTEVLLGLKLPIYAVEPNDAMREAAEMILENHVEFVSIAGTAEATTLPDACVDLITCGQAFHWFDVDKAKVEFSRILKQDGHVALVWNRRKIEESNFQGRYEAILQEYGTDYKKVRHQNVDDEILTKFFGPNGYVIESMDYAQEFDFEGLLGRLMSASYAPQIDHPDHHNMLEALEDAFEAFNVGGKIRFDYTTQVYLGRL